MLQLIHRGVTVATLTGKFTIGRTEGNNLRLSGESVSRSHCVIDRLGDHRWFIRDMGSTNGTLVNGKPITVAQFLKDGDTIQIDDVQLCVQLLELAPQPSQPR